MTLATIQAPHGPVLQFLVLFAVILIGPIVFTRFRGPAPAASSTLSTLPYVYSACATTSPSCTTRSVAGSSEPGPDMKRSLPARTAGL